MTSFELEIDELSQAGSEFMAKVSNELRRVAAIEKASRKLTQQAIADKIKSSRAVVNREISGVENVGARRIGELLWAMGWKPHFEARKINPDAGQNDLRGVEQRAKFEFRIADADQVTSTGSAANTGQLQLKSVA